MKEDPLAILYSSGEISPLDIHFARLMERLNEGKDPHLALAAALVSSYTRQGHICLDLGRIAGRPMAKAAEIGALPDLQRWRDELARTAVVDCWGDYRPLVLDDAGRLYIYRYWTYQQKLAEGIKARMDGTTALPSGGDALKERLDRLFPPCPEGGADWQKIGAFVGTSKSFCVISGGPGTGKTTTVAKILALLLDAGDGRHGGIPRIALAAPTGKAAARLQESIKSSRRKLDCPEFVKNRIPDSASTIHRLLGTVPGARHFRFNEENPLPLDILVVDEASMVDFALMSRMVQALPRKARLILLGDRDQLASVEAGAVLGDICDTGGKIAFSPDFAKVCGEVCGCRLDDVFIHDGNGRKAGDCIVELQRSYRFAGDSGIALLSRAVKSGDASGALAVLGSGRYPDLSWSRLPSSARGLGGAVRKEVAEGLRPYMAEVAALRRGGTDDPHERLKRVFDRFEEFRILCALRGGPYGVAALNILVESILREERLLQGPKVSWYPGRPVLVGRNDYNLRLFNGDIGIFLPDIVSEDGSGAEPDAAAGRGCRVFFPASDGKYRSFHPLRIPEHETVYAMTVHKSQGSEFDNVLLVLPDREAPVLTRELVYTGITRARRRISIRGSEQVLGSAVGRCAERLSGLSDALWLA